MEKAFPAFRTQCPNLFEEKLISYKDTEWGKFLSYKPFNLDLFSETFKKLLKVGTLSSDANILI